MSILPSFFTHVCMYTFPSIPFQLVLQVNSKNKKDKEKNIDKYFRLSRLFFDLFLLVYLPVQYISTCVRVEILNNLPV